MFLFPHLTMDSYIKFKEILLVRMLEKATDIVNFAGIDMLVLETMLF